MQMYNESKYYVELLLMHKTVTTDNQVLIYLVLDIFIEEMAYPMALLTKIVVCILQVSLVHHNIFLVITDYGVALHSLCSLDFDFPFHV